MKRTVINNLFKSEEFDRKVLVKGWVRNRRGSKNVAFVAMNDGSCLNNIQVVVDFEKLGEDVMNNVALALLYQWKEC